MIVLIYDSEVFVLVKTLALQRAPSFFNKLDFKFNELVKGKSRGKLAVFRDFLGYYQYSLKTNDMVRFAQSRPIFLSWLEARCDLSASRFRSTWCPGLVERISVSGCGGQYLYYEWSSTIIWESSAVYRRKLHWDLKWGCHSVECIRLQTVVGRQFLY